MSKNNNNANVKQKMNKESRELLDPSSEPVEVLEAEVVEPAEESKESAQEPAAGSETTTEKQVVRERKFPSWTDLFATVGVFILSALLGSLLATVLMLSRGEETLAPDITFVYYLVQMLPTVAFVVWLRHRAKRGSGIHLGLGRMNFPIILWGVVLMVAADIVIEPLLELFPPEAYNSVKATVGLGGWAILSTVVAAPILEEILFRGLIFESCSERFGRGVALLISALLFGLVHVVPVQMISAFVMGLILGYVYLRTRSLASVIVLHAINNAIAYVSMAFFDESSNTSLRDLMSGSWAYWVVYVLSALLFLWAVVRLWRTLHDNRELE